MDPPLPSPLAFHTHMDTVDASVMLLELPEHLLEGVLAQLDPVSLDCACQSCVSLLVAANRLGAPYAQSSHWLETAASQCLSSLVHCSVGNLLQALRLDYSLSTR